MYFVYCDVFYRYCDVFFILRFFVCIIMVQEVNVRVLGKGLELLNADGGRF